MVLKYKGLDIDTKVEKNIVIFFFWVALLF